MFNAALFEYLMELLYFVHRIRFFSKYYMNGGCKAFALLWFRQPLITHAGFRFYDFMNCRIQIRVK